MNILLVEDEPLAQQRILSILLEHYPDWKVVDTCQSVKELQAILETHTNLDLILCDIHLADGLSFTAFQGKNIQIPVIFITAYDQYALQSFDHNCIDYVLKPIQEERLVKAFKKASQFKTAPVSAEFIDEILANYSSKSYKKRFLTKIGNRFYFVSVDEVAYFYSEVGMTFLVQKGTSHRQLIDYSLNELHTQLLDPLKFYRINRSMIINLDCLVEIKPYQNGRLVLSMNAKCEDAIVVARERVTEFKNWINQ